MTKLVDITDLIEIEQEFEAAKSLEIWDYLTKLATEVMPGELQFEKQPSRIVLWHSPEAQDTKKRKRILTVNPSAKRKQVTLYNYPEIQENKENKKILTTSNYREVLRQVFKTIIEAQAT